MSDSKNQFGYFFNSFQGVFFLIENCMTYIGNIDLSCSAVQPVVFISSTVFHSHKASLMAERAGEIHLFHTGVNQRRKEAERGRSHIADKGGYQDLTADICNIFLPLLP